jgi:hypothetical protein
MRNSWLLIVLLAGSTRGTQVSAQAPPPSRALLAQLASPDMAIRMEAFDRVDHDRTVWQRPEMTPVLIRLLNTEDQVLVFALREKHLGASDLYGEGYGEYTSIVLDRCIEYCSADSLRAYLGRAVRIPEFRSTMLDVIRDIYDRPRFGVQDHRFFASEIAGGIGDRSSWMIRGAALGAMRVAMASTNTAPADRAALHAAARGALDDAFADVRLGAVNRLGEISDTADAPLLRRIAASDTSHTLSHGKVTYQVRAAARAALAAMGRAGS